MKLNFDNKGQIYKKGIAAVVITLIFVVMFSLLKWSVTERRQKEQVDSFYQKLSDRLGVNVLVVGDSIGEGTGTQTDGRQWYVQLQKYLETLSHQPVSMDNVSMGGNASYAGYVRTEMLGNDKDYDLAVICYGQNDSAENFSQYYESIIRAIRKKYPDCAIISILESSQRDYSEKMVEIQNICNYYGIPVADTIAAFNNSGIAYEELASDGVHPSDLGQDLYYETMKAIIDENVLAKTGKLTDVEAMNESVRDFDNFAWYSVAESFERENDTTFVMKNTAKGILGIDYQFQSGDNKAEFYVDGKPHDTVEFTFNFGFSQRHIMIVSDNCTVENEIKIVFATKEQADGFNGLCFSWQ